jgi:plastocyanin
MTSRLRICFSLLFIGPLCAASVSGRVELRDSRETAVRKAKNYSGVVVWLEPASRNAPRAPAIGLRAKMIQKNKTFMPHVLAIRVGTTVDFPNLDPIYHNAFSNYDGQLFDVSLYPPGSSRSVRFTRPGIVRVFCNIHASMSAVIVVLDTPYFAVTGAKGTFEISDVPPGQYVMKAFHERATPATLDALRRPLTVTDDDDAVLPPIAISESGYLPIPHKNKFGRDYPPAPDEGGLYSTSRK